MSNPDISSLLGNYPPQTTTDRTALLDFARTTPLTYGAWKHFKKLYKLAEAPALAGGKPDVELLGILLGRIDATPIPSVGQILLKLQNETPKSFKPQTVQKGDVSYSVGGRVGYGSGRQEYDYDSAGWRLEVNNGSASPPAGGLKGLLASVKSALAPQATPSKRVYDFYAREFIGSERKLTLDDQFLTIAVSQYRQKNNYRLNISDPSFIYLENSGPQAATWQYMKRRARRLLRKLSATQPALYRELLHAALRQSHAAANQQSLNPATQWLSMDALYGRSKNWKQVPASRGPYIRQQKTLEWRTRQENAPDAWNGDLHWIGQILTDTALNPAANATAFRVLQATGQPVPALNENQLQHFIGSNEPVLQAHATRVVAAADDLNRWSPETLALALLHGGAKTRQKIQQFLETKLGDIALAPSWKEAFAARLAQVLETGKANRRTRTAANLLGTLFATLIPEKTVLTGLGLLLEYGGTDTGWIFNWVRQWGQKGDLTFLNKIAELPARWQEPVLAEFMSQAQAVRPTADAALALVTTDDETRNRIGWRYLSRTQIDVTANRKIWEDLIRRGPDEVVHRPALSENAAVELWKRVGWKPEEVEQRLGNSYVWLLVLPFCGFEFFEAFLSVLPPEKVSGQLFRALAKLPREAASQAWERYRETVREYSPTAPEINLAFNSYQSFGLSQRHGEEDYILWEFLAASAVQPETLRSAWQMLWRVDAPETAYSQRAAEVFRRAEIPAADLENWLPTAPLEKFSPSFLLLLLEVASPTQKAALLQRPTEQQWQAIRSNLLALFRSDASQCTDFWNGIWQSLENQPELIAHLGNELRDTFKTLSPDVFAVLLPSATPAHERLALAWLEAHEQELLRDDQLETLILVASNPVAAIRLWGLRRVRERGLNVAIALRLMESGLPQPFALGREYFESAPRESQNEREYALALCDSPNTQVQQYGREFVQRRASTLLDDALLQNLLEHSDAQMQHWAAEQVAQNTNVQTREFDAAVLRGRGRARKAKESVKRRLDQTTVESSTLETGALLELARGNTVRDREWALQQLAKRALSGQEIEGIALKEKN